MKYFPTQNQKFTYLQTNRSDVLGSLWASLNIDLQSNLGALRVSPRLVINTSTVDSASMTSAPRAFKFFGVFFTISGGRVFQSATALPTSAFAVNADTGFKTNYNNLSDLDLFNGILFSTTQDEVWSLSAIGGTWTRRGGATPLTTNVYHGLKYFKKYNRLYVIGTRSKVYSFDTAYTLATSGDYSLDLGFNDEFQILCMAVNTNSVWIGVTASTNQIGRGRIYEWDGISAQVTNEFILDGSNSCEAIIIKDNIPYAVDGNGRLLKFTGYSFQEVGRLPYNNIATLNNTNVTGFIHPNGLLVTYNSTILMNVSNINNNDALTTNENLPSGVWEWSEEFGMVHKYSPSLTRLDAVATITDFGQNNIYYLGGAGALANADSLSSPPTGRNPKIIVGFTYYTNPSTTKSAIFVDDVNDTLQKAGYFVTVKFPASDPKDQLSVQNAWQNIYTMYRKLLNTNDKITIKFRNEEIDPVTVAGTWTSTTTFTTTTDVSALVGYEVEPVLGLGSGKTSHITSVTGSGTYTVTVDETYTGATGISTIRIQNWKKISTVTSGSSTYDGTGVGPVSNWCQFKLAMIFLGRDEVERLIIINQNYNPAN